MWVNACGKLPSNSPLAGSYCSLNSPRWFATPPARPRSSSASPSLPMPTRFSTAQKVQSRKAPSPPPTPSGERYLCKKSPSPNSLTVASRLETTRGSL